MRKYLKIVDRVEMRQRNIIEIMMVKICTAFLRTQKLLKICEYPKSTKHLKKSVMLLCFHLKQFSITKILLVVNYFSESQNYFL